MLKYNIIVYHLNWLIELCNYLSLNLNEASLLNSISKDEVYKGLNALKHHRYYVYGYMKIIIRINDNMFALNLNELSIY